MNLQHLTTDEFIQHLEIYADTDILKKALKVIIALDGENSSYKNNYDQENIIMEDLECRMNEAIEEKEELKINLEDIKKICNKIQL